MYRKISELICILRKFDVFELEHMGVDVQMSETSHTIRHRFREEVIVPIVALSNAYDFFIFSEAKKVITTADNIKCVVETWEEHNICDLEKDIKEMYNIDAWSFIKTWRASFPQMTSMQFLKIKLQKNED